uniref:BAH domain-containing protein n=2 Tax=Macrostomum lignano TaxID=282301 RepID=A0A1I8J2T7_9PLAT
AAAAAAAAVRRSDVANFGGHTGTAPTQLNTASSCSTASRQQAASDSTPGFVPRMAIAHGAATAAENANPSIIATNSSGTDDASSRQVYALWRADRFYYAGRIISTEPHGAEPVEPFRIAFDDGSVAPSVQFNQIVWHSLLPVGTRVCADPASTGNFTNGYEILRHISPASSDMSSLVYLVKHQSTGQTVALPRGGVALTKSSARSLLANGPDSRCSPGELSASSIRDLSSDVVLDTSNGATSTTNSNSNSVANQRTQRVRKERPLRGSWLPEPPASVCAPD